MRLRPIIHVAGPRGVGKNFVLKRSDGAAWEPGKVSEMILEYAQPLLGLDGGSPNIGAARNAMQLVMLCWNLPVLEACGRLVAAGVREALQQALARMPERVQQASAALLRDRTTKFGGIPFLVLLRIEGTKLENARLVAEARMPGASAAPTEIAT